MTCLDATAFGAEKDESLRGARQSAARFPSALPTNPESTYA